MKKLCILLFSFVCFCSMNAFADTHCNKPQDTMQNCEQPCPQTYQAPKSDCFLCTNKNMATLFSQMGISETQICTAMKIQDKYQLEVLSLNERIECEEANLCQLKEKCAKNSDIRKQKNLIKKLKNERKKICKCYEDQFKAILSSDQVKSYNKHKKCK